MVPARPRSLSRRRSPPTAGPGNPAITNGPATPIDVIEEAPTSRLEFVRRQLSEQGLPTPVIETLVAGNRANSHASYQSAWKNWLDWCGRSNQDPLHPDVKAALSFLASLQADGRAYSTLNVHRSMLSSTLPRIDGLRIGEHPLIVRFMKGFYNVNPPRPRYQSTWDVAHVLNFMRTSDANEVLDLTRLSRKCVTLLALLSCLRVSELASIHRGSVVTTQQQVSFTLGRPRKAQHTGALQCITLPSCSDSKVCPVACMRQFLLKSDAERPSTTTSLFMSLVHPYRPVTGSTIGRWIKDFLADAGVDTESFSAHSTRGAAASAAASSGLSVSTILRAANWSSERTFATFYNRPIAETTTFADTILTGSSSANL